MSKKSKPSNFDAYVAKQLQKPSFAAAYERRRLIHEVALHVRAMREDAGLTQAGLAKLIESTQPTIARLEKGQDSRAPRWDMLSRIARALGRQMKIVFEPQGLGAPELVEVRGKVARKRQAGERGRRPAGERAPTAAHS